MARQLPPGFAFFPPPPPPRRPLPRPRWPPPPATDDSSKFPTLVIAVISLIGGALFLLVLAVVCSNIFKIRRGNRDDDATADAAAEASAALALRSRPPASDELRDAAAEGGRPWRGSPTAGLPSFTYSLSIKQNLTDGGEKEAAACSVCLGAFQRGETVRLLPVCLHLYHEECIDPWLHAHSTCPLCRSATDPAMDGDQLPPV
ncbi:hypothetical protein ACP70R_043181 [Stipagrostis hirtigluma subsp. patula]